MKYFKHDLASRDDDKIFELIEAHGMQGYGVWWVLLEELYGAEEQGFQINGCPDWIYSFSQKLRLSSAEDLESFLDTAAELELIDRSAWVTSKTVFAGFILEDIYQRRSAYRLHGYRKHQPSVFERDKFKCVYCGASEDLTLDHVIPRSRGGSDEPENLATCCKPCNSSKHARTPEEWMGVEG